MNQSNDRSWEGILPVNKPKGQTAFNLVRRLRKLLNVQKIGHAGTLDPFATGVMVMLVGPKYTRQSDSFLTCDKEYSGRIQLGKSTTTYDCDGEAVSESAFVPSESNVQQVLQQFQGTFLQKPPMYSAKKVGGKKLYEYARKGVEIDRLPVKVTVEIEMLSYLYPYLDINVKCSKGTYIRSLAHDIGSALGCGGHLVELNRTRSGDIHLSHCFEGQKLFQDNLNANELAPFFKL